MSADLSEIRTNILHKTLEEVIFDGWSWSVVERAARECGYDSSMARAVFPEGLTDVLDAFSDHIDDRVEERIGSVNPEDLRVRDRIRLAVMSRFRILQEYREQERLALRYWSVPTRSLRAGKILWRTADRIWNWAGDNATDYNRYSKRGLLSGVLASTTLAWLDDETPDLQVTADFLDRRIENVMQFGRILGKIKRAG